LRRFTRISDATVDTFGKLHETINPADLLAE
jgi:hypothetical protein